MLVNFLIVGTAFQNNSDAGRTYNCFWSDTQDGPLSNGTTVEPGAVHTYSASVIWKMDGGEPLGLVQAEPAIVSGLIWDVALPNATAA
ncbi:hypothetical protein P8452_47294 [Trifolium repens]|nr:hypothetical protein P8452_47294 [Trifolium repens]